MTQVMIFAVFVVGTSASTIMKRARDPCLTLSQRYCGELEEFGVLIRTSSAEERVWRAAGCPAEIVDEMGLIEVARAVSRCGEVGAGAPQSHRASQPHQGGELFGRRPVVRKACSALPGGREYQRDRWLSRKTLPASTNAERRWRLPA
jgi:hypothetical protein